MIESLRHRSGLRVLASMPFTTRLLFPTVSARECSKYWAKDASVFVLCLVNLVDSSRECASADRRLR
eukprot:scaffold46674_cov350-Skeletonema_marinoi.AAC.1